MSTAPTAIEAMPLDPRRVDRRRMSRASALSLLLHLLLVALFLLSRLQTPPTEPEAITVALVFEGAPGGDGKAAGGTPGSGTGGAAPSQGEPPRLPDGITSNTATGPIIAPEEPTPPPPTPTVAEPQPPVPPTTAQVAPPAPPSTSPPIPESAPAAEPQIAEKPAEAAPTPEPEPIPGPPSAPTATTQPAQPPPVETPAPSTAMAALPEPATTSQPRPTIAEPRIEAAPSQPTPPEPKREPAPAQTPETPKAVRPPEQKKKPSTAPPKREASRSPAPPPPAPEAAPEPEPEPAPPVVAALPMPEQPVPRLPPASQFKGLPNSGEASRLPPASSLKNNLPNPDKTGLPSGGAFKPGTQVAGLPGGGGQLGGGGGAGSGCGSGSGRGGTTGGSGAGGRGHQGHGHEEDIDELQRQIDRLLLVYMPSHPDVAKLQNKIDAILARMGLGPAELDLVKRQVARCWSQRSAKSAPGSGPINLVVMLERNGDVREARPLDAARAAEDQAYAAIARDAADTVKRCGPFALPPEKFRAWQRLSLRVGG